MVKPRTTHNKLTSIITGDLIKSRNVHSRQWLPILKKILRTAGASPYTWEIFRGDSFQVEIQDAAKAMVMAVRIKAGLKSIKGLDVRMAIGVGTKDYAAAKITESNGPAFIRSGENLDEITKLKRNLGIRTPWPQFDDEMNLYIRFALVIMNNWSVSSSQLILIVTEDLNNRDLKQNKIARKLNITQSSVSSRIKRAYYSEIHALLQRYEERIKSYIS